MKIKVEFKGDAGNALVATFDSDTGAVSSNDGRSGTYTRPEGSKTLTIKESTGQDIVLTFADDVKFEPGFSTRFSGPQGDGAATILAIE